MRDTEIDNSHLYVVTRFGPAFGRTRPHRGITSATGRSRAVLSDVPLSASATREPRNILTATIGLPNAPRGRTDRSEPGAPIEKAISG
jgi:hypothetical protein